VTIRIADEGTTPEQKARLIEGATALLRDVLGKDPASTHVVIDQVDAENWGVGGESIAARRGQASGSEDGSVPAR
jgi:4-oxalocrotonate tautomerase